MKTFSTIIINSLLLLTLLATGCQNDTTNAQKPQGIQSIYPLAAETHLLRDDNTLLSNNLDGWFEQVHTGSFSQIIGGRNTIGDTFTIFLKTDGTLWAKGYNGSGQLGLGDYTRREELTQIGTDTNWKSIATNGTNSVYAIKTNGTLWAWGDNSSGQLGDGSGVAQNTPVPENSSASDWKTVTAAGLTCYALKTDDTLWAWGSNTSGQLGDTTTAQKLSPIQVSTVTFKDIATDGFSAIALDTNGSLWSWGANERGQLGQGDTTNRLDETKIGTATDWSKVFVGSNKPSYSNASAFAIKDNGSLWAWGDNTFGQLGQGVSSSTTTNLPVQISGT